MGLTTWATDVLAIAFYASEASGIAYVKASGDRARVHTYIDDDIEPDEACAWIARQPTTRAGQLQIVVDETVPPSYELRFTTERTLTPVNSSSHDAYASQARRLYVAWQARDVADLTSAAGSMPAPMADPLSIEPDNAWLLYGDEAAFPSDEELASARNEADGQIYEYLWTAAKQTQPGDLLFLYFVHERKAVHFVARAATSAWFSGDISVMANGPVRLTQWWTCITPPVAIPPITFAQLKQAFNGDLVMRGRSGRYIPPTTVTRLIEAVGAANMTPELEAVLRTPVGLADLPKPAETTFDQWRNIADGALPLEATVEEHIVEPLFRLALRDQPALRLQKRLTIAGVGVADYGILSGSGPCAVVEVKSAVRKRPNSNWLDCPDFQQIRRYADALGCPSVLIDSRHTYLIAPYADAPHRVIERRTATRADIGALTEHLVDAAVGQAA